MKKILAFLLALAMCSLVACDISLPLKTDDSTDKTIETAVDTDFALEKIGELTEENLQYANNGFYLKDESGKYAIISIDGKNRTDFKYTKVESVQYDFYQVATAAGMDVNNINSLNAYGIVDKNAKEILPAEYALVKPLSERFIYVAKVTAATELKDECLIYYSADSIVSNVFTGSEDDDLRFKGTWQIYDVEKKQMVKGVTGTKPSNTEAYGSFIKYTNDAGETVCVDDKGNEWDSSTVSSNGSYRKEKDDNITYYSSAGEELITVKKDDYNSVSVKENFLIASKNLDDGKIKYFVLDMQGNVISAEFEKNITVYDHIIECDDYIYDYDGNKILDKKYTTIEFDEITKKYYFLSNLSDDGELTIIDKDGNVVYTASYKNNDGIKASSSNFLFYKEIATNEFKYYSYKSKDFKYEKVSPVGTWMVSVPNDDEQTRKLINVLTDEELLDGYKNYHCVVDYDNTVYVYAKAADNATDIYVLK